ncbi:MAG: secretin N-terminal domain-containing protein [Opitutales bacterium]
MNATQKTRMSLAATLAWFGAFAYGADQQQPAEPSLPPNLAAELPRGPSLEDQMAASNPEIEYVSDSPEVEAASSLIDGFLSGNAAINSLDEDAEPAADTGAASDLINGFLSENAVDAGEPAAPSTPENPLANYRIDGEPVVAPASDATEIVVDIDLEGYPEGTDEAATFSAPAGEQADVDFVTVEDIEIELDDLPDTEDTLIEQTPTEDNFESDVAFGFSALNEGDTPEVIEIADVEVSAIEEDGALVDLDEPETTDLFAEPASDGAGDVAFDAQTDSAVGEIYVGEAPETPAVYEDAYVGENPAAITEVTTDTWTEGTETVSTETDDSWSDSFSVDSTEATPDSDFATVSVDDTTGVEDTFVDAEATDEFVATEAYTETTDDFATEDSFVEVESVTEDSYVEIDDPTSDATGADAFTAFPVDTDSGSQIGGGGDFVEIEDDGSLVSIDSLESIGDDSLNAYNVDEVDIDLFDESATDTVSFEDGFEGTPTEIGLESDSGISGSFDIDAVTTESSDIPTIDVEMPSLAEIDLDYGDTTSPEPVSDSAGVVEDDVIDLVDFPDQEIRAIIRDVSDLFDLNVVIPDALVGRTSLKLRNVTWRQVFQVVLEPAGFTYIEDGNIIKIKSITDLEREPTATRVYLINFADASSLQGSLTPLIDSGAGGRIQVDRRTNALIITERPSRMNDIQEVIERLDRPTAQVMIEAKFIDVSDTNDKNLGLDWSSIDNIEIGSFDGLYQASDAAGPSGVFSAAPTGALTTVLSAPEFNVVLRALKRNSNARLISNPTVVAMNNTRALINISEEYPIPEFTFNEERGTFEVSGFEYRPIGILLDVLPQVNSAGFINLTIIPEISSTEDSVNFSGGAGTSTEIPIIDTRKTETTVILKDGYTLAVGGLMEDRESNLTRKLPLFGDIPLAGRLFRADEKTRTVRNLIIFVTARTLNPDGTSFEEIIDPRRLYEMGVDERDIPGYQMPDEERAVYEELRRLRSELRARDAYQRIESELAIEAGFTAVGDEEGLDDDNEQLSNSNFGRGFGVRR